MGGLRECRSVPYQAVCAVFEMLEADTKRLKKLAYLSTLLRQVIRLTPDDLIPVVYLCVNEVNIHSLSCPVI